MEYYELGAGSVEHGVIFFSKLFAPCSMRHAYKPIIPVFQHSSIPIVERSVTNLD